jgi:hypothetical protein
LMDEVRRNGAKIHVRRIKVTQRLASHPGSVPHAGSRAPLPAPAGGLDTDHPGTTR